MDELLNNLKAAVELHRPVMRDKYALVTTDPTAAKSRRCDACSYSVPESGCRTWSTAYPKGE